MPPAVQRSDAPSVVTKGVIIVGLIVFGLSVGHLLAKQLATGESAGGAGSGSDAMAFAPAGLELPNPVLSPVDVVKVQMQALVGSQEDRALMHQVFAFASPDNRVVTGPIDRFERMILSGAYRPMVFNQSWHVGRSVEEDRLATVLVNTVDTGGRLSLFRFYLSRQTGEFDGCWMTDKVACLLDRWSPDKQVRGPI